MVLLERKKLKSTFSQYFREYECLTVSWDFGLTKLNTSFLYGIDIYFCPEGVFHNTDYARAVKRCSSSVSVGLARKYRIGGWLGKHLAVERMLRNDEEYKEYLEDIEPYHGDPVGDLLSDTEKFCLVPGHLLEEEKQLVYWIRQEASKGAKFSACLGRQIKELYYKVWSNLRESKTEVLQ
ncbi:CFF_collapsed_G0017990.mRNA.1.CDS.1 [Saccharomyces cerevisiae]|nr:CFF_collapsed_G0017990.mRNA.1.CDS.1 [Saccharomyces cerevisiae]